jgi:lycopene cyclase domain-containing protein
VSYTVLSLLFLVVAALVLVAVLVGRPSRSSLIRRWWLPVVIAGVVLLALTAAFDNVMISAGLVAYDPRLTSGLAIGFAPIEDFAYPLAGLMLLPALWSLLRKRGSDAHG